MSAGAGAEVEGEVGVDFRRTDSADETESVEISTDLLSDPEASDDSGSPSSSSSFVPELGASSIKDEDVVVVWTGCCSADTVTELVVGVEGDAVVEGWCETAGTLSDWSVGVELAVLDSDFDSSGMTSEQLSRADVCTDCLTASPAELLVKVPFRTVAPDEVVLVSFDVEEATAEHVGAACEPAADRVVV